MSTNRPNANGAEKSCLLSPKSVLIAHPGTQHSHQTALGLYKAGILQKFFTGFFYTPNNALKLLFSILPKEIAISLQNQLLRRRRADLPAGALRSFPFFDLAALITAKIPALRFASDYFIYLHRKFFIYNLLHQIRLLQPKVFIGYEGSASKSFQLCSKLGICKILDHTTGSVFKGKEIYLQESKAFPDLAMNLSINKPAIYYDQHQLELDLADGILVASNYVRENLIEHGVAKDKIYLLPYGADLQAFSAPKRSFTNKKIRLLYAGVISQHKGIMYLLQAFQQLDQNSVKLTLAGKNLLPEGFSQSLLSGVEILNHLPKADLVELYQQSDIFVFPAIHEGSSMVVYEAMASGLPVITTPNAGSIIQDGKDGMLVQTGDVEALKNKIMLLVNNPQIRTKIGSQAIESVKNYSWEKYHDRLNKIVKDIYRKFVTK